MAHFHICRTAYEPRYSGSTRRDKMALATKPLIVDADAHVNPSHDMWVDYLPANLARACAANRAWRRLRLHRVRRQAPQAQPDQRAGRPQGRGLQDGGPRLGCAPGRVDAQGPARRHGRGRDRYRGAVRRRAARHLQHRTVQRQLRGLQQLAGRFLRPRSQALRRGRLCADAGCRCRDRDDEGLRQARPQGDQHPGLPDGQARLRSTAANRRPWR